ncbi:DinB family protein [Paenibacillus contaminans]|uniref:Damage-inducible protein DinB n=1 Tax=Paenibacillus contaminans TaxID=450362 RepID=A0A329MCP5_9BACL|nr:DinB family protein [Paenibacillus contaminans]RAV17751.1 damage-inducible protein DinB [Paenibacillus contaminans]
MIKLFHYNWTVRDEWFEWCKQISSEELTRSRIGGAGSILYTLFHILDVEYSWIRGIQGKPDIQVPYENYKTLGQVRELSDHWRAELVPFLKAWVNDSEHEIVTVEWTEERYTKGEILRHVVTHEIHHMGQLSIWARELGLQPVSANVIGRGLFA